jgi:hypothetical protein
MSGVTFPDTDSRAGATRPGGGDGAGAAGGVDGILGGAKSSATDERIDVGVVSAGAIVGGAIVGALGRVDGAGFVGAAISVTGVRSEGFIRSSCVLGVCPPVANDVARVSGVSTT